jgi:hypothetical protein
MRSSLFLDVRQRRLVITDVSGQSIGPTLDFLTLKTRRIGCSETSVTMCQHTLRNITEEQRSHIFSWRSTTLFRGTWYTSSFNVPYPEDGSNWFIWNVGLHAITSQQTINNLRIHPILNFKSKKLFIFWEVYFYHDVIFCVNRQWLPLFSRP